MKKKLAISLATCAILFTSWAVTVLWFSQAPHAASLQNTDIILIERPSPHTNLYATMSEVRTYAQSTLGSAAFTSSGAYDPVGTAAAATNGTVRAAGTLISGASATNLNLVGTTTNLGDLIVGGTITGNGSGVTNQHAFSQGGPFPTPTTLVMAGDSLSNDPTDWFGAMTNAYPSSYATIGSVYNRAIAGWALEDLTNAYSADVGSVKPGAGTNGVLFVWIGANRNGACDGDTWCSVWSNYVQTAINDGFSVCAFTILPVGTHMAESYETKRQGINNFIRRSGLPKWIIEADQLFPNCYDTNYFKTDMIHLNEAGSLILANNVDAVLRSGPTSGRVNPVMGFQGGTNYYWRDSAGNPLMKLDGTGSLTHSNAAYLPYTVATLPNPAANTFPMLYCSDALTSRGSGGYLRWDGSAWRTWENIRATTDPATFVLYGFTDGLIAMNKVSTVLFVSECDVSGNYNSGIMRTAGNSGSGSGVNYSGTATTLGSSTAYLTGTTTTGYTYNCGFVCSAIDENSTIGHYGCHFFNALCDGTDQYWAISGIAAPAASATYPTAGAFFVYDMYTNKVTGATTATSATNHWLCATAAASSYTYTDSGLTPSTSATTQDRLSVILTNGAALFYTNGSLCAAVTTTLPTVVVAVEKTIIQKTAGSTSRTLYESAHGAHYRHAARNYP